MGRLKGSKNGMNTKIQCICKTCKKTFYKYPSHIATKERPTQGKYCSRKCATIGKKGKMPPNFKGKCKNTQGYIIIYMPNHPFCDCRKHIREHRLVIEKYIGRYLKPKEMPHHINKIKHDNRPENLMLFTSRTAHNRFEKNCSIKISDIIFDGRKIHKPRLKVSQ